MIENDHGAADAADCACAVAVTVPAVIKTSKTIPGTKRRLQVNKPCIENNDRMDTTILLRADSLMMIPLKPDNVIDGCPVGDDYFTE